MIIGLVTSFINGCCRNCDPCKVKEPRKAELFFKAFNLSMNGSETAYTGSPIINNTHNVTITVNGIHNQYSITTKSYELPVTSGNEIEILFEPSRLEETEATFTLPDGSNHIVTASDPSFKWIVPEEFKSGEKIIGESRYNTDCFTFEARGEITLIRVKE